MRTARCHHGPAFADRSQAMQAVVNVAQRRLAAPSGAVCGLRARALGSPASAWPIATASHGRARASATRSSPPSPRAKEPAWGLQIRSIMRAHGGDLEIDSTVGTDGHALAVVARKTCSISCWLTTADTLSDALRAGHRVTVAPDGGEPWRSARFTFDVVVTDIACPRSAHCLYAQPTRRRLTSSSSRPRHVGDAVTEGGRVRLHHQALRHRRAGCWSRASPSAAARAKRSPPGARS